MGSKSSLFPLSIHEFHGDGFLTARRISYKREDALREEENDYAFLNRCSDYCRRVELGRLPPFSASAARLHGDDVHAGGAGEYDA